MIGELIDDAQGGFREGRGCLKIGDLLGLFHCTRVKKRSLNEQIIEVLVCSVWLGK